MNSKKLFAEKGQTLVFVVIGFLAFIAVLALVLDGGNAYAAKRQAQNAADAGALAGATYMCQHRNEGSTAVTGGITKAQEYALSNGADSLPEVTASMTDATLTVTTTVTRDTFFAGVIGYPTVSPRASAAAACRPPGAGVLPVAWSCRADVTGVTNCSQNFGPCRTLTDKTGMGCTYILMDSVKVKTHNDPHCDPTITDPLDPNYCYTQNDLVCSPPGNTQVPVQPCSWVDPSKVDCDLNNDCVDELMTGGARSWLDLNGGGGGANELKGWIDGSIPPPETQVHTWVPEESGVSTSIFQNAGDYVVGKVVILPVFNKVCNGLPTISDPENTDQCNAWSKDDMSLATNGALNFHIISFSAFHVTCVQTAKNRVWNEPGYFIKPGDKDCYGHAAAVANGSIDWNDKSVEGYFVRDNLGGYGGPGTWVDTGAFTVVLVK